MNGTMPPSQNADPRGGLLVRNVFQLGVGQIVSTGLGFLLVAALGRALGASDFGILYIVATIYGCAGVLIDWGQGTYVIRDIARGRSDEPQYIGAAILIRVIGNLCAGVAGISVAWLLGYDDSTVLLVALAAVVGFPGSLGTLFGLLFRGRDRMDLDVLIGLVGKALGVAAVVVVLGLGAGLPVIVMASAVGSVGSFILSVYFVRRFGIQVRLPQAILVRKLFWVGAPIAVMSLSMGVQPFLDVSILSLLAGPAVVGWLGASRTILGIFMAPAGILASATFPELSRSAHSVPDLRRILSSSARIMLAASACVGSALFIFADFAVSITYGPGKFDQATVLLRLTSAVMPLLFLNFLVANAVFAVGRTIAIAVAKGLLMALGAVVSWFAIGYFQTRFGNGAIGTIISFGAMETLMLAALISLLPRGAVDREILLHLVRASVTFGVVVLGFSALPPLPAWVSAPIFGLAFAAAALATRLVLLSDFVRVISFARRRTSAMQRRAS